VKDYVLLEQNPYCYVIIIGVFCQLIKKICALKIKKDGI